MATKKQKRRLRKRRLIGLRVARAPNRGVNVRSGQELKPLPQYYFKSSPPLPPPATKLLPSGMKQIKNGRIQHRFLPRDSRQVGIPFRTVRGAF